MPDADTVARTPWQLVAIGGCEVPAPADETNVSFMGGYASLPADCNQQSAQFRSQGRRFIIVDPDMVRTTAAMCSGKEPEGFLGLVVSWGTAADGRLYLLDAGGRTVFVVQPTAAPGCVASVPGEPNSRKLAPTGDSNCLPA